MLFRGQRRSQWQQKEQRIVLHRLMHFGLIEQVPQARPFIDGAFFSRFAGLPAVGASS